jgi:hypothetical protein
MEQGFRLRLKDGDVTDAIAYYISNIAVLSTAAELKDGDVSINAIHMYFAL